MNDIIDLANKRSEPKGLVDYWREHTVSAILWPSAWRTATIAQTLHWIRVEFSPRNAKKIPKTPGIYAFSISIKKSIMPENSTIVYFGETNSLQSRYRDYLSEMKLGPKRIKFERLFRLWPKDLDFIYAEVPEDNVDLECIEETLNDSVIPECVVNDFSAEVVKLVRVLRG